jgi:hypothetical protein
LALRSPVANAGRLGDGDPLAKDPIRFRGLQANFYVYAGNDPVNVTDPDGEIAPLVVGGIILGSAIAGALAEYWTGNNGAADLCFGAATGTIAGVGAVTGSGALVALGVGANLIWDTEAGNDPGGVADTAAGAAGELMCEAASGPAAPFMCPFAGEALESASEDLRK